MKPVYGQAPIVGFEVTVEELKTDYELYKSLYQASGNGASMTKQQVERYASLKQIFESEQNG